MRIGLLHDRHEVAVAGLAAQPESDVQDYRSQGEVQADEDRAAIRQLLEHQRDLWCDRRSEDARKVIADARAGISLARRE